MFLFTLLLFSGLPAQPSIAEDQQARIDQAFQAWWEKPGKKSALKIRSTGADFDQVLARLKKGRSYRNTVKTGRFVRTRRNRDGVAHPYTVMVPENYDPTRAWPVHFFLHGGVGRPAWGSDGRWWPAYDRMVNPDRIAVFPASWRNSMWWQASQVENLRGIFDELKQDYNLDENRVLMVGISDGGTGAWFFAFRDSTPWSAFLPFISHPNVLSNRTLGIDGEMFVCNLTNKPFFAVNGGLDRLYPAHRIQPYIDLFRSAGVDLTFQAIPDGGHDMRWWPQGADRIQAFISRQQRDPLPDRLVWETERTDRYHRAHWLIITQLGAVEGESVLKDYNRVIPPAPRPVLGAELDSGGERPTRVRRVRSGTLADDAGLRPGDVILELNGIATVTVEDLARTFLDLKPGSVPLILERSGKRIPVELVFPSPPPPPPAVPAFYRELPSGRVELERRDNDVLVKTRGVRRFLLLLSPDRFDFTRPIKVITNGSIAFEGMVKPRVETLLKWAMIDRDRTMLFGAELEIRVRGKAR